MAEPARKGAGINWLTSYPKSGNTWMRMLLANYFSETDTPHDINAVGVTDGIASARWRFDEILGVPSSDLTTDEILPLRHHVYRFVAARASQPPWIKVHDAQTQQADGQWLFPAEVSNAAIYLIRNPLDVAVSFAFHSAKSVTDMLERFCDPANYIGRRSYNQTPQFLGTWSSHVASWVDQSEIPVCVIRYEDMLADTEAQLGLVLAFARPDVIIDPARIAAAVAKSRFDKLQAAEAKDGFREKMRKSERFFRSGRANDWPNHLTPEQARRICADNRAMMERFGYDPGIV